MTGIVVGDVVRALDNPEPTATKLGREWGSAVDWDNLPAGSDEGEVEGLDKASFERAFGPETAYAPRWHTGSFRVPYGMRQSQFEVFARDMATRWFNEMRRMGFDIASSTVLDIRPGPNPSVDLTTGLQVPGYRDYLLSAQFVERNPQTIRLEVPGELFDPIALRQSETSSGEED